MTKSPFRKEMFKPGLHRTTGRYKAPADHEQPAPPSLIERLMEEYFCDKELRTARKGTSLSDIQLDGSTAHFKGYVEEMRGILGDYHTEQSVLDPNVIFSELIWRVAERPIAEQVYAGRPLSTLAQAFYDFGYNYFVFDLTPMTATLLDVANTIEGSPDREKLRLRIKGNTHYCAIGVKNVNIIHHGETQYFAYGSRDSDFGLFGKGMLCGENLTGCTFELDGFTRWLANFSTDSVYTLHPGSEIEQKNGTSWDNVTFIRL